MCAASIPATSGCTTAGGTPHDPAAPTLGLLRMSHRLTCEESLLTFRSRRSEKTDTLAFASAFDPQPAHLDEVAAQGTPLRGFAASGWHTCAVVGQALQEAMAKVPDYLGIAAVDELRWLQPVRPGDELLGFARKQALTPERTNINQIVLSLTDMLRRTLGSQIELVTALQPDLWAVVADRGQIESAILNLALNARDAMPRGGTLSIRTSNVEAAPRSWNGEASRPGPYVQLSVADTGEGMPAAVRARAFEPFFTTKGIGRGTGLGLATIYGFARQSGGTAAGPGSQRQTRLPGFTVGHADRQPSVRGHYANDALQASEPVVGRGQLPPAVERIRPAASGRHCPR